MRAGLERRKIALEANFSVVLFATSLPPCEREFSSESDLQDLFAGGGDNLSYTAYLTLNEVSETFGRSLIRVLQLYRAEFSNSKILTTPREGLST